jgi:hypothetical protein
MLPCCPSAGCPITCAAEPSPSVPGGHKHDVDTFSKGAGNLSCSTVLWKGGGHLRQRSVHWLCCGTVPVTTRPVATCQGSLCSCERAVRGLQG